MSDTGDDDLAAFHAVVERVKKLSSKLYGATTETELNNAYDEILAFLDESMHDDKLTSDDIIMSGFRALFDIARVSLLQNMKLTDRVMRLEGRVKTLENSQTKS